MISEDEYLERVVAGIQSIATAGTDAEVSWNEKIGGRQFDVVVRFTFALVRYLALIEVKNHTRKTEVHDIEAFITKAGDKRGNKTMFVNSAGYQAGAIEVAQRHGIDLFTVTFDQSTVDYPEDASFVTITKKGHEDVKPTFFIGRQQRVTRVVGVKLLYLNGFAREVPSETSQLQYYMAKTHLEDGRTLDSAIRNGQLPRPDISAQVTHRISFQPAQAMTPPDDHFFPAGMLTAVECKVEGGLASPLMGNAIVDPGIFTAPVIYTNIVTGEAQSFPLHMLPLGIKRVKQSQFYFLDHPVRYYFCEAVRGDLVSWRLIESFQNGELIRVRFTQNVKYSHFYIPVADRKILKRLKARLKEVLALEERDRLGRGSSRSASLRR